MSHPIQPLIDRLFVLSRRASRFGHHRWAIDLHERMLVLVKDAQHALWLAERGRF